IADTKFEFGVDETGKLHLIDEALTPDSSRFWPLDTWRVGESPESFDKQYVRNWLDSIGFARKPPAPPMPEEVARRTSEKYQAARTRLAAKPKAGAGWRTHRPEPPLEKRCPLRGPDRFFPRPAPRSHASCNRKHSAPRRRRLSALRERAAAALRRYR